MSNPYLIEIVPVDRGWILETMARAISREAERIRGRFRIDIVNEPSGTAELTYFLPESAFRPLSDSITVTYLAHKEEHRGAAALFEEVARKSDYCITSSTKYQQILEKDGARKVFKIHLGVDTEVFTPVLKLGVVGRTYHTGRKGEGLLAEIAGMPMVQLYFTGEGWPHPAGHYSPCDLPDFYRSLDYLLIPSLIEGGPVPMLEALAAGCQVIAPSDIGLVEDFPHIPFKRGDAKDLRRVVDELLRPKLLLHKSVKDCDWRDFALRHLEVFANIIDEKRRRGTMGLPPVVSANSVPVRVLLVTHGTEYAAKGGPSTRVRFIATRLRADGHTVDIRHNIIGTAELKDYDVIHVFNSWPPQTAHECLSLAKRAGKAVIFSPIVLDLVDWPIFRPLLEFVLASEDPALLETVLRQLPSLVSPRIYNGLLSPVEGIPGHFDALRRCCNVADHLIFLSERERDMLTAIGAKTDHGRLIRNGVSDSFADSADPDFFKQKYGFDQYVLCVGRIEYRKNQALLAMAMRDIDVPLVLIGDNGDPGYLDHVKRVGGGIVHHFARIEDKALLASAYAGASAFVLPSWCEGAPLVALEAGFVGTPLILSEMSSEKEYFQEHAVYINPADVAAIREAILSKLKNPETIEMRKARRAFLCHAYSENEHVTQTLTLYREAIQAFNEPPPLGIVLDVSSLLHSLRIGGHLTGVPLAERHIIAEIMKEYPKSRCIAYNDIKQHFIEIAYRDIENFDADRFNSKYWFSEEEPTSGYDLRMQLILPNTSPPPVLYASVGMGNGKRLLWRARARQVLRAMGMSPEGISRLKRTAKRIRGLTFSLGCRVSEITRGTARKEVCDLSDVRRYLQMTPVQRVSLSFTSNCRIITLGQSWLSNEPLLDKLIELSAGRDLEAYVYDISYLTGAHFSGWADNDDRQRRLYKLLRHCKTVFTESKITAAELAKFASSRALSFNIVRTQLRGKDLPLKRRFKPIFPSARFVLYVSSFNHRKNHDFIVNVWKDLYATDTSFASTGVKLLLVGEIQGETKYAEPEFKRHLRSSSIEVIEKVGDEALDRLYSECLFTVFPSIQEGWGIPVQESLNYGKICIVSNTVPSAIEIKNAALIKLAPNDFFGWREAINTWITNEAMRKAFERQALLYKPPSWYEITQSIIKRQTHSVSENLGHE